MSTGLPVVLLAGLLWLPVPVSAQSGGAYLSGSAPWTESDCASDTPIVVGTDAAAQSDIYSAVTLAGVVDTDCVILAGPRGSDMAASQRARLSAAAPGGYVVGGTAAVPATKLAGRKMTRVGGATRWETAQFVGIEATAAAATAAPDPALEVPADARQPDVFLDGAGPWVGSDCSGDVPIVVGADAAAQSDIYSAVTLAGVVGTDCVILAGPRSSDMAASQRVRLSAAAPGGYVVGGTAAVPTAKVVGRDMTRLAGLDRWGTAQLVGRRASGDATAGTSTTTEIIAGGLTALSVGRQYACGLRSDSTMTCWGYTTGSSYGAYDAPSGTFTAISAGAWHACGLRSDSTATCWGDDVVGETRAPSGTFTAVAAGFWHSCGLRSNSTATCWGGNFDGETDAPSGIFTAIATGYFFSCGLRSNGFVTCWGRNDHGQADAPSGTFTALSASFRIACGLRSNGTVTCWGQNDHGQADAPSGTFTALSAGDAHACGLRSDSTVTCWGQNNYGQADAPPGIFTAVAVSPFASFGLGSNGTVTRWGASYL